MFLVVTVLAKVMVIMVLVVVIKLVIIRYLSPVQVSKMTFEQVIAR